MRIPPWMLRQTCTVEPYNGSGAYGATYGESTKVKCRIEPTTRLVRDFEGNESVAALRCFFPPGTHIPVESRVTFEGKTYQVMASAPHPGPQGSTHHVECFLR